MPVCDELGKRMKENYEQIAQTKLMRRTPVAIRIDGKAFHTFTRGFRKPFDEILATTMQETMKYLCENIQGCVLGYTQSDEITLILQDYATLETDAWFGYKVQKICSIAASMATMAFNKYFRANIAEFILTEDTKEVIRTGLPKIPYIIDDYYGLTDSEKDYVQTLLKAMEKGAMFDARCFNIPKEEVTNLVYWRQLDAIRNATQAIGQSVFSQKELNNKSCNMIISMLEEKGIFIQDFKNEYIYGSCCFKDDRQKPFVDIYEHGYHPIGWTIDRNIPVFKGEDREYIERLINFKEEENK